MGTPRKSYGRMLGDTAFHARNARRSLEEAQGRAPEGERPDLDRLIAALAQIELASGRLRARALQRGGLARTVR